MSQDYRRYGSQLGALNPWTPTKGVAKSAEEDGVNADGLVTASVAIVVPDPLGAAGKVEQGKDTRDSFDKLDSEVRVLLAKDGLRKTVIFDTASFIESEKNKLHQKTLQDEAIEVYSLRGLRRENTAEIISQVDGFWPYWTAITNIDPSRNPATAQVLACISQWATEIVQEIKYGLNASRPVEILPAIMPMIRTPGHGSYPSGNATIAHLEAKILAALLGENPTTAEPRRVYPVLEAMANRIALLRQIAGVHYQRDSECGADLAGKLFDQIATEIRNEKEPRVFVRLWTKALNELGTNASKVLSITPKPPAGGEAGK